MITSTLSSVTYEGNGATTVFPFNFKILNSNYIVVEKTGIDKTIQPLVSSTDYTVSFNESNGSITLVAPLLVDEILLIRRVVPVLQLTDYQNQGAFFAETHENSFDLLTMQNQQQEDVLNHSLHFPLNETVTKSQYTLPDSETRKGKYLAWNSSGDIEAQSSPSTYYNETKAFRDESQTLRNDTQLFNSETLTLKNETEALRDSTQVLKNDTQVLKNDTAIIKTETQAIKDSITSVQMTDVNNAITSHRNESVAISHPSIDMKIKEIVPVGTIIMFYGDYAPAGYLDTINATVSRATFADLWAFAQAQNLVVVESTKNWTNRNFNRFGDGDGSTTFSLPNFNGSYMRHYNTAIPVSTWLDQKIMSHKHFFSGACLDAEPVPTWGRSSNSPTAGLSPFSQAPVYGSPYRSPKTSDAIDPSNTDINTSSSNPENLPWTTIMRFCIKY